MALRMPMMATTIMSSTRVNPRASRLPVGACVVFMACIPKILKRDQGEGGGGASVSVDCNHTSAPEMTRPVEASITASLA